MSGTLQVKSQTIEIGHMQRLRSSRHPISRPTVHSHPCTLAISISHSHSTAFSSCAATEMTTDYFILNSEGESIIVFRAQSRSETSTTAQLQPPQRQSQKERMAWTSTAGAHELDWRRWLNTRANADDADDRGQQTTPSTMTASARTCCGWM